jgi:hypothetical protein
MAFENVFGNIDFMAPTRQNNIEGQKFLQLLGNMQEQQRYEEQMDLKRRQLEQKSTDIKTLSENALFKQEQGIPLTEQEQAAMRARGRMERPQIYTDPFTQKTVIRPSPWASIAGGGSVEPIANPAPQLPRAQISPSAGPVESQMLTVNDLPFIEDMGRGGGVPYNPPKDVVSDDMGFDVAMDSSSPYQANPMLGPRGQIMQEESKQAVGEHIGKSRADIWFDEQKAKNEEKREKQKKLPQEALKIRASFQEAENLNATIKNVYDNANAITTGFVAQHSQDVGGTPAHDLSANLKTIHSDSGLSKLIEVKERGGTFGALQEKELQLLIDSRAALGQTQSPKQFRENLVKYQQQRIKTMRVMADFYKEQYGELPQGLLESLEKNIIDPNIDKAKSGKIFVNPQTGERIQWKDGAWIKAQ